MNNNNNDTTTKKFVIPRCLEASPVVFGLSVKTAVITLSFALMALIMIAKSLWIALAIMGLAIGNLKLEKQFKKEGGAMAYLLLLITKQKSVRVNCTIKSLIQINKK
ncbi:hypothetical protein [Flavobacterium sp. LAR06]|uniref:hypothetical protein n=1 Tax=Flavobacterium sp. LAR06 TaxID=3064897 RepID=UPI0035C16EA8